MTSPCGPPKAGAGKLGKPATQHTLLIHSHKQANHNDSERNVRMKDYELRPLCVCVWGGGGARGGRS